MAINGAQLTLVLTAGDDAAEPGSDAVSARPGFWDSPLRALARNLGTLGGGSVVPVLVPVAIDEIFSQAEDMVIWGETQSNGAGRCRPSDIERVRRLDLDFILAFEPDLVPEELLTVARYGFWLYHHGDEQAGFRAADCVREIHNQEKTITVSLLRLGEQPGHAVILCKGVFKALSFSARSSCARVLSNCSGWPARLCTEIRLGNTGRFDQAAAIPISTARDPAPRPVDRMVLRFRAAIAFFVALLKEFQQEKWAIGVVDAPIHRFLAPGFVPNIRWLPEAPADRFQADPFALAYGNQLVIMFEEYVYRSQTGLISVLEYNDKDEYVVRQNVIQQPVHLSYPYLIEEDGEIYCIPETHQARMISLFRADRFPDEWTKVCVLVEDFPGVDSTVFRHEGYWWLLCTSRDDQPNTNLYGFFAESLTGPWTPHPLNPLKSDVRSSRPGGTPFVHENQLYRPAQDCSEVYGGAVTINRVTRLTPRAFEEETVGRVAPDPHGPYAAGLHTICAVGDRTIVDGKRMFLSPGKPLQTARNLILRRSRSRLRSPWRIAAPG